MNHHDLQNENLSNEELAKIRSSQVKDFLRLIEKNSSEIKDFHMLLYLSSILYDMTKVEKYYFPETTKIAKVFTSAMKNLKCETLLDKEAKSILEKACIELKEGHTISDGVFKVLNSVRLEYLHQQDVD